MPAGGSMMGPAFGDDSTAFIQAGRTELEKLGRFVFDKTGARNLFQMIQDKLPVGTPNMPVSNEVIVLPTIKQMPMLQPLHQHLRFLSLKLHQTFR